MSRISGIVDLSGRPVDPSALSSVASASPARGRSTFGTPSLHVGLGHVAVHPGDTAITSLDHRGVWVTGDVRLDDRTALATELARRGCIDRRDPTDAELLLAAYDAWGVTCPAHLTGDFAFAIWDARAQRLVCARDQLGIKPFHYAFIGSVFVFGSEAVQVMQGPGVTDDLDEVALGDHLINNCHDEERTILSDVRRLPPAHRLLLDGSGSSIRRYWEIDPDHRTRHTTSEECVEQYRELFDRAVSDRLRTPGETVAVGMSGGLDSCSIAATAARLPTPHHVRPVSLAFDRLRECDERRYSKLMRSRLGLSVAYCPAERIPFFADTSEFRPSPETPFLGDESANGDALTMASDLGATVYLTGHAGRYGLSGNGPAASASRFVLGDVSVIAELRRYAVNNGESTTRLIRTHLVEPLLPMRVHTGVRRALGRPHDHWLPDWLREGFIARTGLADRDAEPVMRVRVRTSRLDYRRAVQLGGVGRAIYWYDRAAAQRGMEVRHPFLDRRLVEFLFSIPPGEIAGPGEDRRILRRAMAGRLPDEIRLRRQKTSFLPRIRQGVVAAKPRIARLFDDGVILQSLGVVDSGSFRAALNQVDDAPAALLGGVYFTATLEQWLRHAMGAGHEREHDADGSGIRARRSGAGSVRASDAHRVRHAGGPHAGGVRRV